MQINRWTDSTAAVLNSGQTSLYETANDTPLWRQAVSFYAKHSMEVVKTLLPATAIAYVVALFLQTQIQAASRRIVLHLYSSMQPHGLVEYEKLMIPMQLLFVLKQWFLWACYCFALVGVCRLVAQYVNNDDLQARENVFAPIRERPFAFLKSVALFFLILALGYAAMSLMMIGAFNIVLRAHWKLSSPWEGPLVAFVALAFVSAVLVRWAFAVPLSVIQGVPFGNALKASDRMTDHRMLALWLLLLESEITGYLAFLAPVYLFYYLHIPVTTLTYYAREGLALFLSATTQAPLMIALGLVLANTSGSKPEQSLAAAAS